MAHALRRTRPNRSLIALRQALSRVACRIGDWEKEVWDEVVEAPRYFSVSVFVGDKEFYIDAHQPRVGAGVPNEEKARRAQKVAYCARHGIPYLQLTAISAQEMELAIRIWLRKESRK